MNFLKNYFNVNDSLKLDFSIQKFYEDSTIHRVIIGKNNDGDKYYAEFHPNTNLKFLYHVNKYEEKRGDFVRFYEQGDVRDYAYYNEDGLITYLISLDESGKIIDKKGVPWLVNKFHYKGKNDTLIFNILTPYIPYYDTKVEFELLNRPKTQFKYIGNSEPKGVTYIVTPSKSYSQKINVTLNNRSKNSDQHVLISDSLVW